MQKKDDLIPDEKLSALQKEFKEIEGELISFADRQAGKTYKDIKLSYGFNPDFIYIKNMKVAEEIKDTLKEANILAEQSGEKIQTPEVNAEEGFEIAETDQDNPIAPLTEPPEVKIQSQGVSIRENLQRGKLQKDSQDTFIMPVPEQSRKKNSI